MGFAGVVLNGRIGIDAVLAGRVFVARVGVVKEVFDLLESAERVVLDCLHWARFVVGNVRQRRLLLRGCAKVVVVFHARREAAGICHRRGISESVARVVIVRE